MADYYRCPLSHQLFRNPYLAPDGFTYEYSWLKKALAKTATSPMTRLPMTISQCYPNRALQAALSAYLEAHPEEKTNCAPLTWEEIMTGKFTSTDEIKLSDTTSEQWRTLVRKNYFTLEFFQRMPIIDYQVSIPGAGGICYLIDLLALDGCHQMVRWLIETQKVKPLRTLTWREYPNDPVPENERYYYWNSVLHSTIFWYENDAHDYDQIKYLLANFPELLDISAVMDMVRMLSPDSTQLLLTPYLDQLSKLDWTTPVGTLSSEAIDDSLEIAVPFEYMIHHIQSASLLNFLMDQFQFPLTSRGIWRALQQLPDKSKVDQMVEGLGYDQWNMTVHGILEKYRILETYLRRGGGEIPFNHHEESYAYDSGPVTELFWHTHFEETGYEEELNAQGYLHPYDPMHDEEEFSE